MLVQAASFPRVAANFPAYHGTDASGNAASMEAAALSSSASAIFRQAPVRRTHRIKADASEWGPQAVRSQVDADRGNRPGRSAGSSTRGGASSSASTAPRARAPRNGAATSSASSNGASAKGSSAVAGGGRSRAQSSRSPMIECTANLTTDLPFVQHPQVSFDEYLQQNDRVFAAFFPDTNRSAKINETTWRISMLPIDFFLLSVRPVVDMAIVLDNQPNTAKFRGAKSVITLESTDWELQGVEYNRADFELSLSGALYAAEAPLAPAATSSRLAATSASSVSPRTATAAPLSSSAAVRTVQRGTGAAVGLPKSRLRGRMSAKVGLVAPGILAALPEGSIASVGNALLTRLLGAMKDKVNTRVLEDYRAFVKERTGA